MPGLRYKASSVYDASHVLSIILGLRYKASSVYDASHVLSIIMAEI